MNEIQSKLEEFTEPNYYSRVDNAHVLELFIGMDENGRKSIELRSLFTPRKVFSTSCIEVNQYKKEKYNIIRFSLCDSSMSGLFYKFCEDLIEQTRILIDETDGYQAIINRYYQWKKLFVSSKKNHLTENEIMGLIGEVLFLKGDLKDRIGLSNALQSWSGQELTHKDFSYEESWFEVKAIHVASPSVKISSLEQLTSNVTGELDIYAFEKMSNTYDGITLNKIVFETAELFTNIEDKNNFLSKVAMQGYEYDDYYDDFIYELSNHKKYRISKDFPTLTKENVPKAVLKASYELLLLEIEKYRIF